MKKLGLTMFAAAVLALPLSAQVAKTISADIPFEFVVGNTTAAPGEYVITFLPGLGVQLLGRDHYYVQATPDSPYARPQEPKLIFHRYGNQYFLSQVGTMSTSRDIPMSRMEREAKTTTVAAARQVQTEIVLATR